MYTVIMYEPDQSWYRFHRKLAILMCLETNVSIYSNQTVYFYHFD